MYQSYRLEDFYCLLSTGEFIYVPTWEPWPANIINALIPKYKVPGSLDASKWLMLNRGIKSRAELDRLRDPQKV
jgi:hypothetical protein